MACAAAVATRGMSPIHYLKRRDRYMALWALFAAILVVMAVTW
jgi:hypothetical protein